MEMGQLVKVKENISYDNFRIRIKLTLFSSFSIDIDECSADSSPCDQNTDCSNSDGSYSCTCKQGFTGDGVSCSGMQNLVFPAVSLHNEEKYLFYLHTLEDMIYIYALRIHV